MVEAVTVREVFLEEATFWLWSTKTTRCQLSGEVELELFWWKERQRLEREHEVQEVSVKPRN